MAENRIELDTGTSELLCEIRDRVALITLNRPEARNALSDRLTPALRRMIKQCGDNSDVGALLITGAGNAFCAGGDLKGMDNNSTKIEMALEERVADLRTKQRTLTGVLVAVRKPTVAALPGPAAGADSRWRSPATCASPASPQSCPPVMHASGCRAITEWRGC
jgi:enoyl-CoA hydratase/carnithine racemase